MLYLCSSFISSQQHVSDLSNLGVALKNRFVNGAICLSSLQFILTVKGVALNSSLIKKIQSKNEFKSGSF